MIHPASVDIERLLDLFISLKAQALSNGGNVKLILGKQEVEALVDGAFPKSTKHGDFLRSFEAVFKLNGILYIGSGYALLQCINVSKSQSKSGQIQHSGNQCLVR